MKKPFLLIISSLVLFVLSSGNGYADGWRKVTSYSMEPLYGLYFTSESTGYCVGGNNGPNVAVIYKTTDGGNTWKEIFRNGNLPQLYKVYFINENIGFASGGSASLFKTTDAGQNWNQITVTGTTNDLVGLYFSDEQTGWVLSNSGVLRTSDGGKTWASVLSLTGTTMYDMSFGSKTHGVVTGKSVGDVYYTNDGITWTRATPASLTGSYTKSDLRGVFSVDETNIYASGWGSLATGQPSIIVKSTDGGATWTHMAQAGDARVWDYLYALIFKDKNNGFACGGSSRASLAVRTSDGGQTWSQVNIPTGGAVRGLFSIANTIWACTDDGNIARSKDFGSTWELLPGIPRVNLNAIQSPAANTVYAAGADGAFIKSTDGGKTWTSKFIRINNVSSNIWDMFFVNDKVGYMGFAYRRVAKTTDGGETWKEVIPDTTAAGIYSYGIHFINESKGFVVGRLTTNKVDIIYRTTDGGTTWDTVQNVIKTNLKGVAFADENNGIVVGDGLKAGYTMDGGKSWKISTITGVPSTKTGASISKVTFSDQKTAIAVGAGVVLKSTDSGANWKYIDINGNTESLTGVVFKDALHGWAVGSRNAAPKRSCVYQTSDAGETWTDVADTSVLNYTTTLLNVALDNNNNLWITNIYGSVFTNSPLTGVNENRTVALNSFELLQNYPNPFNPSTTIEYSLPQMSNVKLNVYDALGKCVKTLVNGKQNAGSYKVKVNASDLASGLYLYSLNVDGKIVTKKMSLIK